MATCQHCEVNPVQDDRTLCAIDAAALGRLLASIPAMLDELDVALTRQANLRPVRGGAVPTDAVDLPYNLGAAETARDIRAMLLPWVRLVQTRTGAEYVMGSTSTAALARGLYNYRGWLVRQPEATDLLAALQASLEEVRKVIDLRLEKVFVGSCRSVYDSEGIRQPVCQEHLYAPSRNSEVTCGKCGTVHNIKSRQKQAIAQAENRILPPQVIARALTRNGQPLDVERLYNWVKRGLLKPAALDSSTKRKLYRVGDVLDVMVATDLSPHNPRKVLAA
ncbi:helix-turn-helix DNA binding domain protein [Arthrobacter phage Sonali]|uniref:Helix-turn-helix DNA binding domain protein n=1 Tax=Arthrobacter phage Sonali TaxID=2510495 RepID=A0A411CQT9_9CAUD|nr:helix-turn-helix DNA binding domain protein [Arthrobacter phage Sonali]QAY16192.1 helix-turn-helix DNA binding domain protein [Arthrobacter phage Sonali]